MLLVISLREKNSAVQKQLVETLEWLKTKEDKLVEEKLVVMSNWGPGAPGSTCTYRIMCVYRVRVSVCTWLGLFFATTTVLCLQREPGVFCEPQLVL